MSAAFDADVAVVGAGPAGSATALLLARAGVDVLLLDRCRFPRAKPCGDCLSAQASRLLDRLGVLQQVLAAGPAQLLGWRIVGPGGACFEADFASVCDGDPRVASALAIERARLDDILRTAAVQAGARFLAPAHVHALGNGATDGRTLLLRTRDGPRVVTARMVVGADGLRSVVARQIGAAARPGRSRKFSLTAHLTDVCVDGFGEMHASDGFCAGVAPIEAGATPRCNVTLVADAARFGRDAARDPAAFFRDRLERLPRLRENVRGARFDAPALLASGPFDRPTRFITAEAAALVGDAAGYFDPFTGQGIHHALRGAELLAGVVLAALASGGVHARALRPYARAARRMSGPARALQRVIDAVLARPRLADAAIHRLAARPTAARAILAATGDLRPAFSLLSPRPLLSFAGPRWIERLL